MDDHLILALFITIVIVLVGVISSFTFNLSNYRGNENIIKYVFSHKKRYLGFFAFSIIAIILFTLYKTGVFEGFENNDKETESSML